MSKCLNVQMSKCPNVQILMMEFTYDGMVRQGFGFYNPNHAAAVICAVFPFLWTAWFHFKNKRMEGERPREPCRHVEMPTY